MLIDPTAGAESAGGPLPGQSAAFATSTHVPAGQRATSAARDASRAVHCVAAGRQHERACV